MEKYAIPLSLLAGIVFYAYVAWLAPDKDDPRNAKKIFRNSIGLLGVSAALSILLVMPWAFSEHWSLAQVATAELPYSKMQTAVYAIYASAVAGTCGILHALVAHTFFRTGETRSG